MVKQAVIAGLLSSGCRILDIGMCPVPTIQLVNQLMHGLERTGGHRGIVTMCVGGGQGFAALFERA